jgi:hypothetical protein
MANRVAKLVYVSIMTRVIVDDTDDEETIMKKARPQLVKALQEDGLLDHVENIEDDEEIPFGKGYNDK